MQQRTHHNPAFPGLEAGAGLAYARATLDDHKIARRAVLQGTAITASWMLAPPAATWAATKAATRKASAGKAGATSDALGPLAARLLANWCDGLLRTQIDEPSQPMRHGAFRCPACPALHGRLADAVYPLLHQAKTTGHDKYVNAAVRAVDWMKNVDSPDGAFTNDPNAPASWKGITVFGAVALGEAIHWHGDVLAPAVKDRWLARLRKAAGYIFDTFTIETGHINYPATAAYALTLLGEMFDDQRYRAKGREFAYASLKYLTAPSRLLFGEGRPKTQKSPKGLPPIDLGYNIEESLPSLALYGLATRDEEVLQAVTASLAAHLEFMLPDGGWDNSWGTRNYKWTYWGSRTSDGCQAGYALLADRHPAFATAALRNTQLLEACTRDGLLHGGPHYAVHRVPPCVHHTFCHAKALTTVLDHTAKRGDKAAAASATALAPLPREIARGARKVPELDLVLLAQGPWRGTVSGYDWQYRKEHYSGTGGALSMLWHRAAGPVCAASLTSQPVVEPNNAQLLPSQPWVCLTPRVEMRDVGTGQWFSNVFDLAATLEPESGDGHCGCAVKTRLIDALQKAPAAGPVTCALGHRVTTDAVTITAEITSGASAAAPFAFVLPIIAAQNEKVRRLSPRKIAIAKNKGVIVTVEASAPLEILGAGTAPSGAAERSRIFTLMPGFSALPLSVTMAPGKAVTCTIRCSGRG